MNTATGSSNRRTVRTVAWLVALVVVAVLMVLNTKILTADEAEAINPAKFNAASYAADAYPDIVTAVTTDAVDLGVLVPEILADASATGEKYGHLAGTDKYAIPVTFTGTLSAADANFLTITVPGLPADSSVRISVGPAINGTAIRDVTGTTKFADFQNQTDYQQVANEFKALTLSEVVAQTDVAALQGQQVTVVGVYVTNSGPAATYVITPVSITGGQS